MEPRHYYTPQRLATRKKGRHPEVLFHFTPRDRALKILEDGWIRGRPVVSVTENPSFCCPGPVVFVLDAGCILASGYEIWPHLWQRGAEQEAEWVIARRGSISNPANRGRIITDPTEISLDCVRFVGMIGIPKPFLMEAAEARGVAAGRFEWDAWWSNGPKILTE